MKPSARCAVACLPGDTAPIDDPMPTAIADTVIRMMLIALLAAGQGDISARTYYPLRGPGSAIFIRQTKPPGS
jgi:hypothetical protein